VSINQRVIVKSLATHLEWERTFFFGGRERAIRFVKNVWPDANVSELAWSESIECEGSVDRLMVTVPFDECDMEF